MAKRKEGETRKQELLSIALELFSKYGYDGTSIERILRKAGVSKGAFYYHFSSKEDVIEQLAIREVEGKIHRMLDIANRADLRAIDKLNALIEDSMNFYETDPKMKFALFDAISSVENFKLYKKISELSLERGISVMCTIIEQGNADSTMHVKYIDHAAEFYINTIIMLKARIVSLKNGEENIIRTLVSFYEQQIAHAFGVSASDLVLTRCVFDFLDHLIKGG